MVSLREAAQQALEALEKADKISGYANNRAAITALRAALAEPVQEPVFLWGKAIGVEQKCGCLVCGIGADGKAYGYVCSRSDCPTRVTCGGAA